MSDILADIPEVPTLKDLYRLLAVTAQQIANYGQELRGLRVELTRLISQQAENVRANALEINHLERGLAQVRIDIEAIKAWQLAHQFTCPYVGLTGRDLARAQLASLLKQHFSVEELDEIGFELGINPDDLAGETTGERARELILHTERNNRVLPLITICQRKRPSVAWPLAYE
ncbi:MAG: hypothetical protein H6662_15630 [Ardenticatenaceae bacterium]|nr:hypothetical protein [Anaerolineales bacterium]MCB8923018.1 hypothetical protein [Ardenticatenaceae bacterium]